MRTTTSSRAVNPRNRQATGRAGADRSAAVDGLLPSATPIRFLDTDGKRVAEHGRYVEPPVELQVEAYRRMVVGRRFDQQATALTKQGRLAVYPSSHGQEACQVGGVLALRATDWLFPTYRESVAMITRGIDPVQALTLLRGDWHCGYDPTAWHTAPQCTPLATQSIHAAGLAYAEKRKGTDTVALAFVGDGATSEGDFHEGLNFAAVFGAPVVYLVQNNRYAISVPLAKQTHAPSLAYKGVGYGVRSEQVDGNDPLAVLAVMTEAVAAARDGQGPFLLEAHTYRLDAHTNADDATRYRTDDEVRAWQERDPVPRLGTHLRSIDALDDATGKSFTEEAEAYAADLRTRMNADPELDPMDLFAHVYAEPTPHLAEQRDLLRAELDAED